MAKSRPLTLIQLSLKMRPSLRKLPNFPSLVNNATFSSALAGQHIIFLLIVVTLCTSRDIYHPISVATNTSQGLRPQTHLHLQLPSFSRILHLLKPYSGFFLLSVDPNKIHGWQGQPQQAHNRGVSKENVSMS